MIVVSVVPDTVSRAGAGRSLRVHVEPHQDSFPANGGLLQVSAKPLDFGNCSKQSDEPEAFGEVGVAVPNDLAILDSQGRRVPLSLLCVTAASCVREKRLGRLFRQKYLKLLTVEEWRNVTHKHLVQAWTFQLTSRCPVGVRERGMRDHPTGVRHPVVVPLRVVTIRHLTDPVFAPPSRLSGCWNLIFDGVIISRRGRTSVKRGIGRCIKISAIVVVVVVTRG